MSNLDLITVFGAVLVGGGLFSAFMFISMDSNMDLRKRLAGFDEQTGEILSVREQELRQPLAERVFLPFMNRLGTLSNRWIGTGDTTTLERNLAVAGFKNLTPGGFMALRLVAAVAGAIIGFILAGVAALDSPMNMVVPIGMAAVGLILPKSRVDGAVRKRQKEILRAMPAALDLLTICVQGGLSFDAALGEVASKYHNTLSNELNLMLNEVRLGRPRRDALRALEERIGIQEVTSFVDAVLQSEQLGSSMADTLTIQSEEIRRRRRQKAEEMGQKAPIKMLLPLVGCIFPTIFVILLGPAALVILRQVMGVN